MEDSPLKRVLPLDGGGIRGRIQARVLIEFERRTGKSIASLFDFIVGTSTGGILALGLTKPAVEIDGPKNYPEFSAVELSKLYDQRGKDIFRREGFRRFLPEWLPGNLAGPRYGSAGINHVLEEYFGDVMLSQALTTVMVTAYDTLARRDRLFLSAQANLTRDVKMRDAAQATSAAPTFFPAAVFTDQGGDTIEAIDGGVGANNPAMDAWVEARKLWPGEEIFIVSLGTGTAVKPLPRGVHNWGAAKWAPHIVPVVMDSQSDKTAYHLQRLLNGNHVRLQPVLPGAVPMDDVSPENLRVIDFIAERQVTEQSAAIDRICEVLTR